MTNSARSAHTVRSSDGTPITYVRSGNGSPIVLVHGAGADASSFALVARELARSHTVLLVERRGRKEPIDPSAYAMAREYEDLVAVAAEAGEPVHLAAHSYGALCALGAVALQPERFRALTMYEPPIPTPGHPYASPEDLEEIERLSTSGALEEAVVLFLRRVAKIPEHEIEWSRSLGSVWEQQVARAHVFRWEGPAVRDYQLDRSALAAVSLPISMILGARSEEHAPGYFASAAALQEIVPNMRTAVLPGQFHLASVTDPVALAQAIEDADRRAKT